jgi:Tfp pilus assembly major pilin PilA
LQFAICDVRLKSIANQKSQIANPRRGFTIAEAMIASVVLAASVIGIAGMLAASYQQNAVRGNMTTALALAQQLMEEIASKPLDPPVLPNQPGWSTGHTDRRNYDTVDDYNGYSDMSSSITTNSGTPLDLGDGGSYTRRVSVQTSAKPSGLTGTASDFVLVTVTVTMPRGQTTSISQLFTRATIYR